MWEWLKLPGAKPYSNGGIVPKPIENEVFSEEWEWQLYTHELPDIPKECRGASFLSQPPPTFNLYPTGEWMIETKFSGEQILHIEARKDGDPAPKFYSENRLKIRPLPRKVYTEHDSSGNIRLLGSVR